MTLEKEILEEFIEKEKKEWISDNSLLFNKEELERLIQLTQSKIIQIIDKRVEELKIFQKTGLANLYLSCGNDTVLVIPIKPLKII